MPCPANYHDTTPSPRGRLALQTPWKSARLIEWSQGLNTTSWWFRHHWKTWVKMGIFPNFRGEHTKILETSTWTQQWDPFLKRNCENFQIVLSKNDLNHLHHCLLSSLVKKKPHLLLHQKTKMICDLFLCLQLGLWWNAGIGTWGWRNAKQKTTQRLDAVLAVTNPFLTAETPIDFLLYFLVLGVFFLISFFTQIVTVRNPELWGRMHCAQCIDRTPMSEGDSSWVLNQWLKRLGDMGPMDPFDVMILKELANTKYTYKQACLANLLTHYVFIFVNTCM